MSIAWFRGKECKCCERVEQRLDLISHRIGTLTRQGAMDLALTDDILAKVRVQTTKLDGLKVLVDALKANAANPEVLAEIVLGLDANNVAIDVMANTEPEVPPTA